MRHRGLHVRMAVAGTILFGFYAALVAVFKDVLSLPVVLGLTLLFVGFQYKFGKWMALRSVKAEDMDEDRYREVHRAVEDLSADMGIDKPRLMVGEMGVPNAFAVGRKGAGVVVVSDTLMDLLDREELEGVLAHELAHIKNRDVTMMLLGQSVASLIGIAVFWVVALADDSIIATIVGWVVSTIAQLLVMVFVLAISRYREYIADSDAAEYTNNPEALGRALVKIREVGTHERAPDVDDKVGALCIFGGERGLLSALFASHPPMEKRVERLAPHLLEEA